MSPVAHLLFSWLSTVEILKNRRERALVTFCGVAPDLDGLGLIIDKITGTSHYYLDFHHYLGHSVFSAICLSMLAFSLATTQRLKVWVLSFTVIHFHYLCDIIGSRGPDGYQWPVYYFYPLDKINGYTWHYQWELNAWQNSIIIVLLLSMCFYYLVKRKVTFFEVFNSKLNDSAIDMFNKYIRRKF